MTLLTTSLKTTLSALALLAALSAPAMAQEATAENTDENPPSVFNMGEEIDENGNPIAQEAPEPQEPQVGQEYLREVFTDWALRCRKTADGNDPCQMYQLLSDASGNPVAEIAIVALPSGGQAAAGATIVVPLETLLTEQLTMRVDGGTARRFPYTFCNVGGCVTRIGLRQEEVDLLRRGNTATLRMVPAASPESEVVLTMSLSGFTAAFTAVSQ